MYKYRICFLAIPHQTNYCINIYSFPVIIAELPSTGIPRILTCNVGPTSRHLQPLWSTAYNKNVGDLNRFYFICNALHFANCLIMSVCLVAITKLLPLQTFSVAVRHCFNCFMQRGLLKWSNKFQRKVALNTNIS